MNLTATAGNKSTTVNVDEVKLYEVTLTSISTTLNSNSWNVIRKVADMGQASNYWKVGDRKAVVLNGTVGALTLSNYTTYCFILGFDHNAELEGNNTIHFQFGKTALSGGTDIAFVDGGYDNTYSSSTSARFIMNTTNTNSGGWKNSYMRNTICSSFLNALPTELQNSVIECDKYTDNTGGTQNVASYVTVTKDKSWLLGEIETQGKQEWSNSEEKNKQVQYQYYKNGNSKIKYKFNATTTSLQWWNRSPDVAVTAAAFCLVATNGGANDSQGHYSFGFAPAFAV